MKPSLHRINFPAQRIALGLSVLIFVLFAGGPMVALIARSITDSPILHGITSDLVLNAVRLSVLTSTLSLFVMIILGTPVAYALARVSFPGRNLVNFLVELPLVLPPIVAGIGLLLVFGHYGYLGKWMDVLGIHLPFTMTAVVLAQIFVASPFYIRAAKLGFETVNPDYEDISQTLGVSPWMTFWRISVRLSLPSLISGLTLAWARSLSEFGGTLMFAGNYPGRTQTMPLAILTAMEQGLEPALDLAVVLIAFSVATLAVLEALRYWGQRWVARS